MCQPPPGSADVSGIGGRRRCQGSVLYATPTVGALSDTVEWCVLLLLYRGTWSKHSTAGLDCHWSLQGELARRSIGKGQVRCAEKETEMTELLKRELGHTGLQVTMLGYGAMELRGAP